MNRSLRTASTRGGLALALLMAMSGCTPHENALLIRLYAAQYHVDANTMLGIASCESNFVDSAINKDGEWNYGLFQMTQTLYNYGRTHYFGGDNPPGSIMNPAYNASTAAAIMANYGLSPWRGDPYLTTGRFCVVVP